MFDELLNLFLLALPIAWAAWTVTKEDVFREFRDYCSSKTKVCQSIFQRKFYFVWTCEYCFSHYVTAVFLIITGFKLVYDDWRGYFVSGPALVCVANVYMSLYNRLRVDLRKERATADLVEKIPPKETKSVDKEHVTKLGS